MGPSEAERSQGRKFVPTENKRLDPEFSFDLDLVPRIGDLLVTRSNTPAYVGDACAIDDDPGRVVLCDLIYRLKLDRRLLPQFAVAALLRDEARRHLSSTTRGTSPSMVKLRGEDIKATPIPPVSTDCQRTVLTALHSADAARERASSLLRRHLQLLNEHRRALITSAVTGQLEVA